MYCCRAIAFTLPIFAFLYISACKDEAKPPPLTQVKVSPVQKQAYHAIYEYVGRIEAVNDAAIQAQVTGYLKSTHFIEGDVVEQDALLFVIEPSTYEAKLAAAKASVAQASALLEEAQLNYNRGSKLIKRGAISRSELDRLTAKLHSTEADLQSARANQKAAMINLQHTRIKAPFKGRVGQRKFSIGDLVTPSLSEPLTTVVSIDPIYATFQVNAKTYSKVSTENRQAKARGQTPRTFTAQLKLSSGDIYSISGKLDFVSNRINSDTDSIMIRAKFANSESILRPGQYVRVLIESDQPMDVLTVSQAAIISNQEGDSIFIVADDNKVKSVKLTLGASIKDQIIVENDGLKEGQRVIVAGIQKVKEGQKVDVQVDEPTPPSTKNDSASP